MKRICLDRRNRVVGFRLVVPQAKELAVLQLLLEGLVDPLVREPPRSLRIIRNDDWSVTHISHS